MGVTSMAAATQGVRIIFTFNLSQGIRIAGWSESYDLIYATIAQATTSGATAITNFITRRLNCLGCGVLCESITLSQDLGGPLVPPMPRRATYAWPVPPALASSGFASLPVYSVQLSNYPADFSTTVYYISLQTDPSVTPFYRRNIWIAGAPDAADQTTFPNMALPIWQPLLNAFLNVLAPQGSAGASTTAIAAIRSVDASSGNPIFQATAVDATGTIITLGPPYANNFIKNQVVVAEGWRAKPGGLVPHGRYKVQPLSATTIGLLNTSEAISGVQVTGGFRAVRPVWNPALIANAVGWTKRDKGGPFGEPVGRHKRPKTTVA